LNKVFNIINNLLKPKITKDEINNIHNIIKYNKIDFIIIDDNNFKYDNIILSFEIKKQKIELTSNNKKYNLKPPYHIIKQLNNNNIFIQYLLNLDNNTKYDKDRYNLFDSIILNNIQILFYQNDNNNTDYRIEIGNNLNTHKIINIINNDYKYDDNKIIIEHNIYFRWITNLPGFIYEKDECYYVCYIDCNDKDEFLEFKIHNSNLYLYVDNYRNNRFRILKQQEN
jgi:hypothetical protein